MKYDVYEKFHNLSIEHKGQSLRAFVSASDITCLTVEPDDLNMDNCQVDVTHLEDSTTGAEIALTDEIRDKFKVLFLSKVNDEGKV